MALNSLWKTWEDHESLKLSGTEYSVKGFSIAALRTNFYIKELGIMLDAGLSGNLSPDYIFVTHGHADHCANLPYHLYSVKENQKINIYVPEDSKDKFSKFLESAYELGSDQTFVDEKKCYELVGVNNKLPSLIGLTIKNKQFNIEIIPCDHSVPCVGYG